MLHPESNRTFLVPVPDRTADTQTTIIHAWIEPGTMVISDSWDGYCDVDCLGYTHHTVNHSIYFVNPDTGDHTNTIESTWRCVKVFLRQYNRGELSLPSRTLHVCGEVQGVPPFSQFLHLVATTDWSQCDVPHSSACTT